MTVRAQAGERGIAALIAVLAVALAAVLVAAVVVAVTWSPGDDGSGDRDGDGSGGGASPSPTQQRSPDPAGSPSPTGSPTPTGPEAPGPASPAPGDADPDAPAPPSGSVTPAPDGSLPPAGSGIGPGVVTVAYRIERRTQDDATAGFPAVTEATLTDPRGWQRARFRLVRDDRPSTPYVVVLAEPDEVDRLCLPYDTYGKYSCQNGPVVALNADRWREATPQWTGDLGTYRQMLVNHEVGHLLGMRHPPKPQCPVPGRPALVMSQQSTELRGCLPNPWPLEPEIERAARHDQPLAPGYGE
jgi:hypothetical protein